MDDDPLLLVKQKANNFNFNIYAPVSCSSSIYGLCIEYLHLTLKLLKANDTLQSKQKLTFACFSIRLQGKSNWTTATYPCRCILASTVTTSIIDSTCFWRMKEKGREREKDSITKLLGWGTSTVWCNNTKLHKQSRCQQTNISKALMLIRGYILL